MLDNIAKVLGGTALAAVSGLASLGLWSMMTIQLNNLQTDPNGILLLFFLLTLILFIAVVSGLCKGISLVLRGTKEAGR